MNVLGRVAYWLSWPLLYVYLRGSQRTRVAIFSQGSLLVVKPWLGSGKWMLPGGGLHKGEPVIDGALREIHEEVGLTLLAERFTHVQTFAGTKGFNFTAELLTVQLADQPQLRLQRIEIAEARWVSRDQISQLNCGEDVLLACQYWS